MLQCRHVQPANAPVRTDDEGQGKRIPVAVGIGCLMQCWIRTKSVPVFAVISGDVGAIGPNGDPGFSGWIVGYSRSIAVGRGLRRLANVSSTIMRECGGSRFWSLGFV